MGEPYSGSTLRNILSFPSSSHGLPMVNNAQGKPNVTIHSLPQPCFKAMVSQTTKAACNAYLTLFLWPHS